MSEEVPGFTVLFRALLFARVSVCRMTHATAPRLVGRVRVHVCVGACVCAVRFFLCAFSYCTFARVSICRMTNATAP